MLFRSVQVEKLEKNMAKLTVEVPAEEVEKALQAAYMKEKNKISIPGFRKGKVPRAMIEKMYGAAVFYEEAANILIQDNYAAAMEESKEDIVSRPTIDVVQIESGKPFIFTAEVAVRPEVTLGKYKGVQVTKIDTTVTDEEVEAALEKEQQKNSRTVTVTDRPVANGDTAVIDFEGFVDGVAFEGGKGENHPLEIGSHSFIDTFEDQLVGHNAGDEVEVNVTFPEKYQAADLAGKPAVFKVKINEIKAKELPELNDEFAQDVSEFNTLEEYKEDLKKHLEVQKEDEAKRTKEDEAIQKIIDKSTMEIPDNLEKYLPYFDAVLLENHGALTWSTDLNAAYMKMESVEFYAQLLYQSKVLGGPKEFDEKNIKKLYEIRRKFGMAGKHPANLCLNKDGHNCHNCGGACHDGEFKKFPGYQYDFVGGGDSQPEAGTADKSEAELVAEITKQVMAQLGMK